jgi:predicted RNase H-like HicB family nuclease
MKFSALVRKGDKQYVALCPELDVVSQGPTIDSALENLQEAVELFLEDEPSPPTGNIFVTQIEVKDEAPHAVRA